MKGTFRKQFWSDLKSFTREYWVEVFIFFIFVGIIFALGLYIF